MSKPRCKPLIYIEMTKSCCWLNLVKLVSFVLFEHRERSDTEFFIGKINGKKHIQNMYTMFKHTYGILFLQNN